MALFSVAVARPNGPQTVNVYSRVSRGPRGPPKWAPSMDCQLVRFTRPRGRPEWASSNEPFASSVTRPGCPRGLATKSVHTIVQSMMGDRPGRHPTTNVYLTASLGLWEPTGMGLEGRMCPRRVHSAPGADRARSGFNRLMFTHALHSAPQKARPNGPRTTNSELSLLICEQKVTTYGLGGKAASWGDPGGNCELRPGSCELRAASLLNMPTGPSNAGRGFVRKAAAKGTCRRES